MNRKWLVISGIGLVSALILFKKEKPKPSPSNKPGKTTSQAVTASVAEFVKKKLASANRMQSKHGIPYLFALAQWGLESGWGKHAPGNNFFGIKSTPSWKGKVQKLMTTEYINGKKVKVQSNFRAYDTWDEAVEDWVKIIKLKRYAAAFNYKKDPRQFAREIKKGGYATDPNYETKIIGLIDKIEAGIKKELKV